MHAQMHAVRLQLSLQLLCVKNDTANVSVRLQLIMATDQPSWAHSMLFKAGMLESHLKLHSLPA